MSIDRESTRMEEIGDGDLPQSTRVVDPYAYRDPAHIASDVARDETPPPENHTRGSIWPDAVSRDSVRCYPCNKLFHSASALKEHQTTSQLAWHANLICPSCAPINPFKSHAEVQAHYRTPEHSLLCAECDKFFDDETELDCHFAQSHSDHLSCYRCSLIFDNTLERRAHFYDSDYHALIRFAGRTRRKILRGPGTDVYAMPPPPPRVYPTEQRGRSRTRRSRSPEVRADRFNHRSYDAQYRRRDYPRNSSRSSFRRDDSREYFHRRKADNCTYVHDFGQPDVHVTRTRPHRRPTDFGRDYLTPRHRVRNPKHHDGEERFQRGRTVRYGRGGYKKPPGFVPGRTNRNNDHVPPATPRFGGEDFIPYNFHGRPRVPTGVQAQEVISYEEVDRAAAAREPSPLDLDAPGEIIAVSYNAPAKHRGRINIFSAVPPEFFKIAIKEYARRGDGEGLKKITHFMQYDWEYSEAAQLEMVKELEGVVRVGREFMREAGLEMEGVANRVGGVRIGEMEDEADGAETFHAEAAQTEHPQTGSVDTEPIQTDIAQTEHFQETAETVDQEKEDESMLADEQPQVSPSCSVAACNMSPLPMLRDTQKEQEDEQLYGEPDTNHVDSPRSVMACDGSVAAPSSPVARAGDGALEDMVDYGDSQDELYCDGCGSFFHETAAMVGHGCDPVK